MTPEFFVFLSECEEGYEVQLRGKVRHYPGNDHWYIDFDGDSGALFFESGAKKQVVKVLDIPDNL